MNEAGFNVVRLAEFAWSKMELRKGEYNFEWLDKAIETLSEKGIKAVLGTPTAAPPPWIIKAHPDILWVDGYGRRAPEGQGRTIAPTTLPTTSFRDKSPKLWSCITRTTRTS